MARLRGNSTVGGKAIVTLDMMNEFIDQIQTDQLADKFRKAELEDKITNFDTATEYVKNSKKNGLWEITSASNMPSGFYNNGSILSFANESSRLQVYTGNNDFYYRTGWKDTIGSWNKLVTANTFSSELKKKFDKTGGDINGNILVTGYISSDNALKVINNNKYSSMALNNNIINFSSSAECLSYNFDKKLYSTNEIYANSNKRVWHEGNFNPNNYISKNTELLEANVDLDTLKTTGIYRGNTLLNTPDKIGTKWCYIEVIKHNDSYVLQKVYGYDGNHAFFRVLENNTWKKWKSLTGALVYSQNIATENWVSSEGIYEATITHNLGSENITSVMVMDNNKVSMFIGFQIISSTVIKVFSSTNTNGKIIINAV